MAQGPLLGIFHSHNPGSSRRSPQLSQPPSPGLRNKVLPTPALLHHGATCLSSSHPSWATPLSSSLSTTASAPRQCLGHQYLHSCSSPSPWLCSALVIPGRGAQGCAAQQLCPAPRRRHPSTTGTFTPLLTRGWPFQAGPEPRQPGCQLKRVEGGRGKSDMQQGSGGSRHRGLAGRCSGSAQGTFCSSHRHGG